MGSPVAPLGLALFSQRILYTCRPAGAKDPFENTHAAGEVFLLGCFPPNLAISRKKVKTSKQIL